MKTTLNNIKASRPCEEGWKTLLKSLGKTEADDTEVSILHIIESNGIKDAIWALRAVKGHDREIRLFAVWCARQVQHLMIDKRSLNALDVAERFALGQADKKELAAAWAAAWVAAAAAAAARAAAAAAARDAARDAAAAAARDAAAHAQKQELIRICNQVNQ